jgi:hypothetical protein
MSYNKDLVDRLVRTHKDNLLYDSTNGVQEIENYERNPINRITKLSFDKKVLKSRFKMNNMEFYTYMSPDENELLEWRYEVTLDKEFNTAIVLILNDSKEPISKDIMQQYLLNVFDVKRTSMDAYLE